MVCTHTQGEGGSYNQYLDGVITRTTDNKTLAIEAYTPDRPLCRETHYSRLAIQCIGLTHGMTHPFTNTLSSGHLPQPVYRRRARNNE